MDSVKSLGQPNVLWAGPRLIKLEPNILRSFLSSVSEVQSRASDRDCARWTIQAIFGSVSVFLSFKFQFLSLEREVTAGPELVRIELFTQYSSIPEHRNWQIETAFWNLAGFLHFDLETR